MSLFLPEIHLRHMQIYFTVDYDFRVVQSIFNVNTKSVICTLKATEPKRLYGRGKTAEKRLFLAKHVWGIVFNHFNPGKLSSKKLAFADQDDSKEYVQELAKRIIGFFETPPDIEKLEEEYQASQNINNKEKKTILAKSENPKELASASKNPKITHSANIKSRTTVSKIDNVINLFDGKKYSELAENNDMPHMDIDHDREQYKGVLPKYLSKQILSLQDLLIAKNKIINDLTAEYSVLRNTYDTLLMEGFRILNINTEDITCETSDFYISEKGHVWSVQRKPKKDS